MVTVHPAFGFQFVVFANAEVREHRLVFLEGWRKLHG